MNQSMQGHLISKVMAVLSKKQLEGKAITRKKQGSSEAEARGRLSKWFQFTSSGL